MSDSILGKYTELYTDLPLTQFPINEDDWNRMSDVSASLSSLVQDYNKLCLDGRYTEAKKLLDVNEGLLNCFFNADKYNQLRDATIAMQRFILNEVENLVKEVAKNTIGITDNPTDDQKKQTTYSSKKIDDLFDQLSTKHFTQKKVTIPLSGWSNTFPYTNTVAVVGLKDTMTMRVVSVSIPDNTSYDNVKAILKSAGFLISNGTGVGNEKITFKAYKKPTVNFTVIVEGG